MKHKQLTDAHVSSGAQREEQICALDLQFLPRPSFIYATPGELVCRTECCKLEYIDEKDSCLFRFTEERGAQYISCPTECITSENEAFLLHLTGDGESWEVGEFRV